VLISTSIVESGLDIPTANTLIVHRADMFGLAQLYQLRGRVGRSKVRGYAYFTVTPDKILTPLAQRRLEVMQSLDTLGAGFALASQDLDIRGAGNLVGEEQSGQIKEVGVALYQHMLEEAILNLKEPTSAVKPQDWSPQLNLGLDVFIPESYVADLNLRLSLYRQISSLETERELQSFAAELVDRFGKLPEPVENLLEVIKLKNSCKQLNIHKIDVGPKGVLISFYKDTCSYGDRLIALAQKYFHLIKLRPDQKVVVQISENKGVLESLKIFLGWLQN
jgi:transcription-repair coupling factor (superfamily II helicase)